MKQFSEVIKQRIDMGWLSITSGYGWREFQGKREWHNGIDLAPRDVSNRRSLELEFTCKLFAPISADPRLSACGLGAFIYEKETLRWGVCHLRAIAVQPSGAIWLAIGSTGRSTGVHLHLTCAIFDRDKGWQEVDPLSILSNDSMQRIA